MAVVPMPGAKRTPAVQLAQAVDRVPDMKACVVLDLDHDGNWRVTWSAMSASTLCMAALVLSEYARRLAMGELGDE